MFRWEFVFSDFLLTGINRDELYELRPQSQRSRDSEIEDGDTDSCQLLNPWRHRRWLPPVSLKQNTWLSSGRSRGSITWCRQFNNYAMLSSCRSDNSARRLANDLKLLGGEASLTRSFDCDCAQFAHAHRRSPVTVSGYVTCAAIVNG